MSLYVYYYTLMYSVTCFHLDCCDMFLFITVHLIISYKFMVSLTCLPPLSPSRGKLPLPKTGPALCFFLLKGSFSFLLLPKGLLIGDHMTVGVSAVSSVLL